MTDDLIAKLRAVKVRTPEEVMADYRCGQQLGVDDLINRGRPFYRDTMRAALCAAEAYAGTGGIVASLPLLVAGKAQTDKEAHYLWKNWFTPLSEEHYGIDSAGKHGAPGGEVVVTIHGEGILAANKAFRLTAEEWDDLLVGRLPDGNSIDLYTVDDIRSGRIPEPFGRYGVVLDIESARSDDSGNLMKDRFMVNPLVHARVGTLEYLEEYFEKAKHSRNLYVRNWHAYSKIGAILPRGDVLCLSNGGSGLSGSVNISNSCRFVGVARGDVND